MPFRALFLVAPLALVATGSAQTVLLRFKPPVGKTVAYTMTMAQTMNGQGAPTPTATSMTYRIVSRKGTTTTLETKIGAVGPAGGMTTTTVDELGNLKGLDSKGGMARMGAGMMQGAQGVSFPQKALKVGDTWGATLDLSKLMGGMTGGAMKASGTIPIVYRLTALKGGVATISVSMKGNAAISMGTNSMKMAMKMAGTMMVETATGLMKSMNSATDNDIVIGAGGQKMKQHMVIVMKQK